MNQQEQQTTTIMKTLEKNTQGNLAVIKYYAGEEDHELYIIDTSEFKMMPISSTYDRYGQKVTAEDAGDYLTVSSQSLLNKVNNELKETLELNEIVSAYDHPHAFEYIKEHGNSDEYEITEHMCKAYNYFDGSNYKSVIIECDTFETFYEKVDQQEEEAILGEYEDKSEVEEHNTGVKTFVGQKYLFRESQFAGAWEVAQVQLNDYID